MEARSLSQCGSLTGWSIFQVKGTNKQHIIGHSQSYDFDVITPELAFFDYDKQTKSGRAVTKSGVLYQLEGRPLRFSPTGHPQLREFSQTNDCEIQFIKL